MATSILIKKKKIANFRCFDYCFVWITLGGRGNFFRARIARENRGEAAATGREGVICSFLLFRQQACGTRVCLDCFRDLRGRGWKVLIFRLDDFNAYKFLPIYWLLSRRSFKIFKCCNLKLHKRRIKLHVSVLQDNHFVLQNTQHKSEANWKILEVVFF